MAVGTVRWTGSLENTDTSSWSDQSHWSGEPNTASLIEICGGVTVRAAQARARVSTGVHVHM